MMKDERKPLRYITKGMVAINFCWREKKKWQENEMSSPTNRGSGREAAGLRARYLVQAQSVEEIHGDVGLRQVDYQPGAHVEQGDLQGDRITHAHTDTSVKQG